MSINRVGVIGWPIEHSLSPAMHNAAFRALAMHNWRYDKIAIPPDSLQCCFDLREQGYVGINVTVPHKQTMLDCVQPDEKAQVIGAVNTVDFRDNTGTNTDVDGFIDDLKAHSVSIYGERVLVLGAGGSARAVVYGLLREGAEISIINRTPENAQKIVDSLINRDRLLRVLDAADGADCKPSLIVNCTPAGMWPNVDVSPWAEDVPFPYGVTVYDLVYRPAKTKLMQQAEANGGRAIGGLGMLVRQGAAAFKIWTGVMPPIDVMFDAVKGGLSV
jgi:shikimate dehydrogenase